MSSRDRRKAEDRLRAFYEDTGRPIPDGLGPPPRRSASNQGHNAAAKPVAGRSAAPGGAAVLRPSSLAAPGKGEISREKLLAYTDQLERRIIELAGRYFEPIARISIFIIYFWFGFLKLIGSSPATPLASALTSHTIGMQYFNVSFKALAVYECALGILFLIPAMTWLSAALLMIHMGIVSSPLVIVANVAWIHPFVPTLEGQYIIKDLAIIAVAIGILALRRAPAGP